MRLKIFLVLLISLINVSAFALTLPAVFSDNMVLEQNSEVEIWGWGKPKEPVRIVASWNSSDTIVSEVAPDARWRVKLQTPAGSYDPQTITVMGYNWLEINNVAIGEVILCSGQSNMEWSIGAGIKDKETLLEKADRPGIRMFTVDYRTADAPTHDVSGLWRVSNSNNINSFSAIGYVIATRMEDELKVPVGVVNSSWGGTPIECWTPSMAYEMCDYLRSVNDELSQGEWGPCRPGKIFNAMVAPLEGYKFACCVWYQGEENTNNPRGYTDMLFALVNGYRETFGINLPFVYAQIAPYNYGSGRGVEIRERQRRAMAIPNSAMVVIGDLGEKDNIHPQRKIESGNRLVNAVLKSVYSKENCNFEFPNVEKVEISGSKVVLTMANANGLHFMGKTSELFEICGSDKVWQVAKVKIVKNKIELTASSVKTPVAARYAWGDDVMPDMFNADNIPASSFTTEEDF